MRGLNGCFSEGFVSRVKLIFYIFNFLTAEIDSNMEKIIYTFNYFFLFSFKYMAIDIHNKCRSNENPFYFFLFFVW